MDNKGQEVTLEELKEFAKRRKAEVEVEWAELQEEKPKVIMAVLKEAINELRNYQSTALICKDLNTWRVNDRTLSRVGLFTLGIEVADFRRCIKLIPEIEEIGIDEVPKPEYGKPVIAIGFHKEEVRA